MIEPDHSRLSNEDGEPRAATTGDRTELRGDRQAAEDQQGQRLQRLQVIQGVVVERG